MVLGFGYLYVCYVYLFFLQKAENNRFKKKPVGQNFVISFFCFCSK